MFFDTHAHLNFKDYDKDRENVIGNSLKKEFFLINVGTDIGESEKVVEIADSYREGVYASVGLHPLHIEKDFTPEEYKSLAKNKKVVAIGETGLDYKYILKDREERKEKVKRIQKTIFEKQIDLSSELELPLILHCRMAHDDLIEILRQKLQNIKKGKSEEQKTQKIGVVHCFSGNLQQAKEYMDLGFFLGINGIIFKLDMSKVIKEIPLEKILLETDCPFLVPPEAGVERNEPLFVRYVAREVARVKRVSEEDVARTTTKNAKNLFSIS